MKKFLYSALLCLALPVAAEQQPQQDEMLLRLVVGDSEYRQELETVNSCAHELCRSMNQAVIALVEVKDTHTAQAAAPAVQNMRQAEKALKEAISTAEQRGITPGGLYMARRFGAHVRRMPIQAFNEQLLRILQANCFDCPELFLALTDNNKPFSPEAIAAPINEADTATLQELEAFYTRATRYKNGFTMPEMLQQVDALQAKVDVLANTPRAAMKRTCLEERYKRRLIWEGGVTGDFEERCILRPDNFLANLFTNEYRKRYFCRRSNKYNQTADSTRLQEEAMERHKESFAAACRKYCTGSGDGRTPQTALHLKQARRDTCTEIINQFSREAFGADYVFSDPQEGRVSDVYGRPIVRALAIAGRSNHKNKDIDTPYILLTIYFYYPRY